jgi:hypothetical protein
MGCFAMSFNFLYNNLPAAFARIFNKASLDLNFARNKSLLDARGRSLVTFTRASSGTYVGDDGLIKTATTDEPRFDHDPLTGECLGLLIEESKTNLLTYSEEANNAAWNIISSSVTVSPDAISAPDGATTADKIIEATTTGGHTIEFTGYAFQAGTTYTASVFVKAAERSRFRFTFPVLFTNRLAFIDVGPSTYQVLSDGGMTVSIIPLKGDWFRVTATSTATTTGNARVGITLVNTGTNASYTGDGVSGLYLWGAQLETTAFATSYIPTTNATVTRSADVASITGANFSSWYRQDEGTLFADTARSSGSFTSTLCSINDGTLSNRTFNLRHDPGSQFTIISVTSGTLDTATTMPLVGERNRIAVGVRLNDLNTAADGSFGNSDTSVLMPTVNQLNIGNVTSSSFYSGTIRRLTYWPVRLTNPFLLKLTRK